MHTAFQTPTTPRTQVMSHESHPEKHRGTQRDHTAQRDSRFAFEDDDDDDNDENIGARVTLRRDERAQATYEQWHSGGNRQKNLHTQSHCAAASRW